MWCSDNGELSCLGCAVINVAGWSQNAGCESCEIALSARHPFPLHDSFAAVWLNFMHVIRSVSVNRFDKIKDQIKAGSIKNHAGENTEKIASDFLNDWKELHCAGLCDQNLSLTMLNAIMEAGGTTNEDFKHPLREIKIKLNKKLLEMRHLTHDEKHRAMVKDNLDVKSLLTDAKDECRTLLDDNKWPAAMNVKDNKALNSNYGSVDQAATKDLKTLVNALVQQQNNRDKSNDTCNQELSQIVATQHELEPRNIGTVWTTAEETHS